MSCFRRARWLAVAALLSLTNAAAEQPAQWRRVTGPPELDFPRDHGAHPEYRTEWWYVTGLVADAGGRRFGFQITFFRHGLDPAEPAPGSSTLRARQVAAAHLAIADLSETRFHHAQRIRRLTGGLAGMSPDDLELWLDDWQMKASQDGLITVRARDPEREIGLELELRPERDLVRHGDRGYSQKGREQGNASVYLSWPRLAVAGELEVAGETAAVAGTAWFDHEWGTSTLGEGVLGWDWFSLRFDDGSDLMLYRLRRADGSVDPRSSGTRIRALGGSLRLNHEDVEIEELGWWESPTTGALYPTRWRLRLPNEGIDLEVRSLLDACELDGTATTGVVYWEGPIEARGSHKGEGYVELTGYAGTLDGRF